MRLGMLKRVIIGFSASPRMLRMHDPLILPLDGKYHMFCSRKRKQNISNSVSNSKLNSFKIYSYK